MLAPHDDQTIEELGAPGGGTFTWLKSTPPKKQCRKCKKITRITKSED